MRDKLKLGMIGKKPTAVMTTMIVIEAGLAT